MSEEKKIFNKARIIISISMVMLFGIVVLFGFLYWQARQKIAILSTTNGQQQIAQQQIQELLKKVAKHILLPSNETPTVATITDSSTVRKNQPFFDNAQNGDQVIVYVKTKKAIIYSPSKDIIVNVGFVTINSNATQTVPTAEPVTIEIRNGTQTAGLAQNVSNLIKKPEYIIQKMTDAQKKDYTQTVIIYQSTSSHQEAITTLAKTLNAQVTTVLPTGEPTSQAQILIILGSNQIPQ